MSSNKSKAIMITMENNNSSFKNNIDFEKLIKDVIRQRWESEYPNDFIVCTTRDLNERANANHAPSTWYNKVLNGHLPHNIIKKIQRVDFDNTEKAIQMRIEIYNSLMNATNLKLWCIENICV